MTTKTTTPSRTSNAIDQKNMSLLASPLFSDETELSQTEDTGETFEENDNNDDDHDDDHDDNTTGPVSQPSSPSPQENENLMDPEIHPHESLLQDASLWMRELESIRDELQMVSVRVYEQRVDGALVLCVCVLDFCLLRLSHSLTHSLFSFYGCDCRCRMQSSWILSS
jgi:hypothetical protein